MKLALTIFMFAVIFFGLIFWPKGDQPPSGGMPTPRVDSQSEGGAAPVSSLPDPSPLSPEMVRAVSGLRASFGPGGSRFARARQMVAFDKLWQDDPPVELFVREIIDPASLPEYRSYLAGCLRKAGKKALPEERDGITTLLKQALRSPEVEVAAKPDLALTLITLDERPETIAQLARLAGESSDDGLRACFLTALAQSRNSQAPLLSSVHEMGQSPNRWGASLAVILPPLILSGDHLKTVTLEKILMETQNLDLLQRSSQALTRLPDTPTKERLLSLATKRFTQLSPILKQ